MAESGATREVDKLCGRRKDHRLRQDALWAHEQGAGPASQPFCLLSLLAAGYGEAHVGALGRVEGTSKIEILLGG